MTTPHSDECYKFYQRLGLSPLGAEPRQKRPLKSLGKYGRFRKPGSSPPHPNTDPLWTGNIQLMLGQEAYGDTKIVVLDIDSYAGFERFSILAQDYDFKTWVTETPNGGCHFYFRIPPGLTVMEKLIWLGKNKHEEIRLLGEGKLAMAPPSSLDSGGRKYIFASGCSPREVRLPAILPDWIRNLPPAFPPKATADEHEFMFEGRKIPNKLAVARGWGLKVVGGGGRGNWVRCHIPWREDANPSGSINVESGVIKDFATGESISFLSLAVIIGAYKNREDARIALTGESRRNVAFNQRHSSFGDRGSQGSGQEGGPGHGRRGTAAGVGEAAGDFAPAARPAAKGNWWEVPARVRPAKVELRQEAEA